MNKVKLSVILAVRNEGKNLAACLKSVQEIADEIVIVDEFSVDQTVEIAKSFGARVYQTPHEPIFHKTKQKALDLANGEWVLQLDADERVTKELRQEIIKVIDMSYKDIMEREYPSIRKRYLFWRQQSALEKRDGKYGKGTGEYVAFFIPRINYFVGKPLIHAGVYPDGVIRLFKRGKARFPAKSVHEQIEIDGEVAWLFNDLEHHDSPTLNRYFWRLNRYTNLTATELEEAKVPKNNWNLFKYMLITPFFVFLKLYFKNRGYKDKMRGFLWSFLSASHFPIAYFKYRTGGYN